MLIKKHNYLEINEFFLVRKYVNKIFSSSKPRYFLEEQAPESEPVKKIPGAGQKRTGSATLERRKVNVMLIRIHILTFCILKIGSSFRMRIRDSHVPVPYLKLTKKFDKNHQKQTKQKVTLSLSATGKKSHSRCKFLYKMQSLYNTTYLYLNVRCDEQQNSSSTNITK